MKNKKDRTDLWRTFAEQIDGRIVEEDSANPDLIKTWAPLEQSTITFFSTGRETHAAVPLAYLDPLRFVAVTGKGNLLFRIFGDPSVKSGHPVLDKKFSFKSNDAAKLHQLFADSQLCNYIQLQVPCRLAIEVGSIYITGRAGEGLISLVFDLMGYFPALFYGPGIKIECTPDTHALHYHAAEDIAELSRLKDIHGLLKSALIALTRQRIAAEYAPFVRF